MKTYYVKIPMSDYLLTKNILGTLQGMLIGLSLDLEESRKARIESELAWIEECLGERGQAQLMRTKERR